MTDYPQCLFDPRGRALCSNRESRNESTKKSVEMHRSGVASTRACKAAKGNQLSKNARKIHLAIRTRFERNSLRTFASRVSLFSSCKRTDLGDPGKVRMQHKSTRVRYSDRCQGSRGEREKLWKRERRSVVCMCRGRSRANYLVNNDQTDISDYIPWDTSFSGDNVQIFSTNVSWLDVKMDRK